MCSKCMTLYVFIFIFYFSSDTEEEKAHKIWKKSIMPSGDPLPITSKRFMAHVVDYARIVFGAVKKRPFLTPPPPPSTSVPLGRPPPPANVRKSGVAGGLYMPI